MGNACSSACVSDGSSLETKIGKCQNNPCKCALSCFKSVKEEIQIDEKIKELIEVTIQQQISALQKNDDHIKPEVVNDLP